MRLVGRTTKQHGHGAGLEANIRFSFTHLQLVSLGAHYPCPRARCDPQSYIDFAISLGISFPDTVQEIRECKSGFCKLLPRNMTRTVYVGLIDINCLLRRIQTRADFRLAGSSGILSAS